MKADILHHGPHHGQTTHLRCEGINLISALSDVAEEAFDGIGRLNVTIHRWREGVKRQQMVFILKQASYRFWIPLHIFGFERSQVDQRLLVLATWDICS